MPRPSKCAAETHKAEIAPLDLMLLHDRSGSMSGAAGMRSKWQTAQAALASFVSDPKSAGLNVGLQFFPLFTSCTTDADGPLRSRARRMVLRHPSGGGHAQPGHRLPRHLRPLQG